MNRLKLVAFCGFAMTVSALILASMCAATPASAAEPAKAVRPVRDSHRKRTPTVKRPIAKWITIGW